MTIAFINTRPSEHTTLTLDGINVIDLPLLELSEFEHDKLTPSDHQAMQDFLDGAFKVVVVVSIKAAQCAIKFLQKNHIHYANQLSTLPIFVAVGTATQNALAAFGFKALVPDIMNNEGMLAMPVMAALQAGDKVLIWRGVGGRRLLHNTLAARQVKVCAIEWYQRYANPQSLTMYRTIDTQDDTPTFVLISSQLSLQTWAKLPHHRPFIYMTLGDRLTQLTQKQYPNASVIKLDTLESQHIQQTILHHLESL